MLVPHDIKQQQSPERICGGGSGRENGPRRSGEKARGLRGTESSSHYLEIQRREAGVQPKTARL